MNADVPEYVYRHDGRTWTPYRVLRADGHRLVVDNGASPSPGRTARTFVLDRADLEAGSFATTTAHPFTAFYTEAAMLAEQERTRARDLAAMRSPARARAGR